MYLNTIPFADNTFGIQAAAQRFFSTTARESLTLIRQLYSLVC